MHIYAFGSICRGEVSLDSDIDLLAIVEGNDRRFDANIYSIYSYRRIDEIWKEGNPFAWHLYLEAKLIYASDNNNYLLSIGSPSTYKKAKSDCQKFLSIFIDAKKSILDSKKSAVLDLSTVFLSIRNIATCFLLGKGNGYTFSRNSALGIGENSIPIEQEAYQILERSRLLCTRGHGRSLTQIEIDRAIASLVDVEKWLTKIVGSFDE